MAKSIYTLNDFRVGDTVYLLPINNTARGLYTTEEIIDHIKEIVVTKIGRKYITVGEDWAGYRFEHHDAYVGLKQVSDYSPNYELYKNKEDIVTRLKRSDNVLFLRGFNFDKLTNESITKIISIINSEKQQT